MMEMLFPEGDASNHLTTNRFLPPVFLEIDRVARYFLSHKEANGYSFSQKKAALWWYTGSPLQWILKYVVCFVAHTL